MCDTRKAIIYSAKLMGKHPLDFATIVASYGKKIALLKKCITKTVIVSKKYQYPVVITYML